jgi:Insertion element 4 transposase N-terminal/Transposase DDE domain
VSLSIRQIPANPPLEEHLALEVLGRVVSPETVASVLDAHAAREERRRKLPAAVVVLLCIAMNLFCDDGLGHVFYRLAHGLRWLWPKPTALSASDGGLCRARYRLGARPLATLFRAVCRPLATPETPGAFLFGRRLLAIDSEVLDLADTLANDKAYGRATTDRGKSAWPQARLVGLCECGTHAFLDAGLWPYSADQHAAARRLLRSVDQGTLVTWDCGLHSFDLVSSARRRRAHILSRLPAGVHPELVQTLSDGTELVRLRPSNPKRRRQGEQILVRLIRYTLDDPARPGHGEEHRLITSLVNPRLYSAEDLVMAYHSRWEYELTVDEVETHQRPRTPLRSKKPVGVVQEVYGLLLAHYLVRTVMADAAHVAALPPTRLSFVGALRVIRATLPDFQRTAPCDHSTIYQAMLEDIVALKLPERRNRTNPRVVKQKMSNFRVKRPCHRLWSQPTKPFRNAIVLLK